MLLSFHYWFIVIVIIRRESVRQINQTPSEWPQLIQLQLKDFTGSLQGEGSTLNVEHQMTSLVDEPYKWWARPFARVMTCLFIFVYRDDIMGIHDMIWLYSEHKG